MAPPTRRPGPLGARIAAAAALTAGLLVGALVPALATTGLPAGAQGDATVPTIPTDPAGIPTDPAGIPTDPADLPVASQAEVVPLDAPASTSRVRLVRSEVRDGWRYTQYRNPAYPCSTSGDSTFMVAEPASTAADAVAPLWVYLHGGGFGYFDSTGTAQPDAYRMVEESFDRQVTFIRRGDSNGGGLLTRARAAGFRMLAVSSCHHDGFMGGGQTDPNNPAPGRRVSGLLAAKAAVAYTLQNVPTDDFVVHGTSAGSFGAWSLAWALDAQGLPATAVIGDSGVLNEAYPGWIDATAGCGNPNGAGYLTFRQRVHPDLLAEGNDVGSLIADGRISSPVLDVWVPDDPIWCGAREVACPVGGDAVRMGATDCMHEEVRLAIVAQGPFARSRSMRLCVDDLAYADACDRHVPTVIDGLPNDTTRSPWPAGYLASIMGWVADRLGDDGASAPASRTANGAFAAAATADFLGTSDERRIEALTLALDAGQSRATLLRRLTTSRPWLEGIVADLYLETLGRPGDPAGTAYWVDVLATGRRTVAQVAASFYASPEYAGTDPAAWVGRLYTAILHRSPEPGAVGYWVGEASRRGRTAVALRLFQSAESAGTRVAGLYAALLGRAPSATDVQFWGPRVVAQGDLTLAVSLASSAEYQARARSRFP